MRHHHVLTPIAVAVLLAASPMTFAQSPGPTSPIAPATGADPARNPNALLPASPTGAPPQSSPGRSPSDASGATRPAKPGDYETDQYGNRKKATPKPGSAPVQGTPSGAGNRPVEGAKPSGPTGDSTLDRMKSTVDSTDRSMAATPGPTPPRPSDLPSAKPAPSGSK